MVGRHAIMALPWGPKYTRCQFFPFSNITPTVLSKRPSLSLPLRQNKREHKDWNDHWSQIIKGGLGRRPLYTAGFDGIPVHPMFCGELRPVAEYPLKYGLIRLHSCHSACAVRPFPFLSAAFFHELGSLLRPALNEFMNRKKADKKSQKRPDNTEKH